MINTYSDLFWGYTAIWFILAVYIFTILRRLKNIENEIFKKS